MKFLLLNLAFSGILCFFYCLIIAKYFKLSVEYKDLKSYIKKLNKHFLKNSYCILNNTCYY